MEVETLGVDDSINDIVDHMWPPSQIVEELDDLPCSVRLIALSADTLADCDAVVTVRHTDEFFNSQVKWVHTISAGVDQFPLAKYRDNGVVLTNSSGIHSESGGEHALTMMLMLAGRHHDFARNQSARRWERPNWDEPFTVHGESVCTIGTGAIGASVAERANCLGMRVHGVNRSGTSTQPYREVFPTESLLTAIDGVRFVVLTVPLTEETWGLIGRREFEEMRDDSFLINISRGDVVDEAALVDALNRGDLRGAGLDVFHQEPLPEDSPLWDMPNVVITPHCAGYFNEHFVAVANIVRENVRRLGDGEALLNVAT